ncbi:MAG: hypothetical protein FWF50_02040 [Defluviitaleaceae bacterium]|nr:hypothetical protein [Defluviitaleaceae bacterium]
MTQYAENIENENIVFKANKDGIVIILPEKISFNELKTSFNKKVLSSRNFFGTAKTRLVFKGRELSEIEEKELLGLMYRYTDLDIVLTKKEEPKLSLLVSTLEEELENQDFYKNAIAEAEEKVFHYGSLRSGQAIEKEGSLVLIGDVKPGSEVKVSGNVVVLGTINGLVHAGYNGNRSCSISALKFSNSQIRIADTITHVPKRWVSKGPSHAYIEDDKIFVKPLT